MLAMAESKKQADADGKSRRLNYSTIACSPGIATPPQIMQGIISLALP
jgi:hypothetical protein